MRHVLATAMLGISLPGSGSLDANAASFTALGSLPGENTSRVLALSDDGSTVVGISNGLAFRWNGSEGMRALGDLPGGSIGSWANAVSADGSVVVGESSAAPGRSDAFRWSESEGMTSLDVPGSHARGVSADGTIIVGERDVAAGKRAFRWDSASGAQDLGDLPGLTPHDSRAYAISADGTTIVGSTATQSGPFRWDSTTGMQDLVGLADHSFQPAFNAIAWAVSADGSVVAGSDWSDNIPESGFRWTADGGGELISYGNEPSSIAIFDISPDGTTVVGQAQVGTNEIGAFIWRADTGLVSLTVLLTSMGVDLTGWTLRQAVGISADGTTIAGNGTNPSGRPEGFLIVIPEPSVGILMGIGLLGLASRGSTKRRHGQNRSGSQP